MDVLGGLWNGLMSVEGASAAKEWMRKNVLLFLLYLLCDIVKSMQFCMHLTLLFIFYAFCSFLSLFCVLCVVLYCECAVCCYFMILYILIFFNCVHF